MIKNPRILAVILLCIVAVMFYAGLKPKGFRLRNEVSWIGNTNGIRFGSMGIAFTKERGSPQTFAPESLSIELVINVPRQKRDHLATIFTIWDKHSPIRFALTQWDSTLIVEKRHAGIFKDRIVHVGKSVSSGNLHAVVITSGRTAGTTIYIDGVHAAFARKFDLCDTNMVLGRLVLGNSAEGHSPWGGTVYAFAMHACVLSPAEVRARYQTWMTTKTLPHKPQTVAAYTFDERSGDVAFDRAAKFGGLCIPALFEIPAKEMSMPWKDFELNKEYFSDVIINLAGFMPLGFFVFALLYRMGGYGRRHGMCLTILTGTTYSLFIELAQLFMPTRSSQVSDLILNVLGTFGGALMIKYGSRAKTQRSQRRESGRVRGSGFR
jgi:hypothetical protein